MFTHLCLGDPWQDPDDIEEETLHKNGAQVVAASWGTCSGTLSLWGQAGRVPSSAARAGRRLPSAAVPLPDEAVSGPGQAGGTPDVLASVRLGVSAVCPGTQFPQLIEGLFKRMLIRGLL